MFAQAALIVLGLIVFNNYRSGQLPTWLRAKFFNDTPATRRSTLSEVGGGDWPKGRNVSLVGTGALPDRRDGLGGADGNLVMPVSGTLTGRFGDPRSGHRHAGVDWAAPTGTPVRAARAGRVSYAGTKGTYGSTIDIDHGGGLVTRYAHLSRIGVRLGQQVRGGDVIGAVGNSGRSTGPHLHFEVRRQGVAVDPLPLVTAGMPGGAVA